MFRSLFDRKPVEQLPEVANLTVGRTFSIDPIEMKLLGKDALFQPPEADFKIVAQGFCDLGEQSFLHRFYPDDDRFILQVQGGNGRSDTRIDEIVLWYVYDVQYLSRDREWDAAKAEMRKAQFTLPSEAGPIAFDRVWFDHTDADEDPMTYHEDVYETKDASLSSKVYQTAMLFGRGLADGSDEMLLVNLEEPDQADRAVSHLVGRAIPPHSLLT